MPTVLKLAILSAALAAALVTALESRPAKSLPKADALAVEHLSAAVRSGPTHRPAWAILVDRAAAA